MTFINILVFILAIMGVVGGILLVYAGILYIYIRIENWRDKRKITETIKKEVEDERLKRETRRQEAARRFAGTGNPEIERAFEQLRTGNVIKQPEDVQQVSSEPEYTDTGRYKPSPVRDFRDEERYKPDWRESIQRKSARRY